jgi:hypothetical protein
VGRIWLNRFHIADKLLRWLKFILSKCWNWKIDKIFLTLTSILSWTQLLLTIAISLLNSIVVKIRKLQRLHWLVVHRNKLNGLKQSFAALFWLGALYCFDLVDIKWVRFNFCGIILSFWSERTSCFFKCFVMTITFPKRFILLY